MSMESNIRRTLDLPDEYAEAFVVFIEATPRYVRGPSDTYREYCVGETYSADLYHRPVTQPRPFVCSCGHRHRDIDIATRCGYRLARRVIPTLAERQK